MTQKSKPFNWSLTPSNVFSHWGMRYILSSGPELLYIPRAGRGCGLETLNNMSGNLWLLREWDPIKKWSERDYAVGPISRGEPSIESRFRISQGLFKKSVMCHSILAPNLSGTGWNQHVVTESVNKGENSVTPHSLSHVLKGLLANNIPALHYF